MDIRNIHHWHDLARIYAPRWLYRLVDRGVEAYLRRGRREQFRQFVEWVPPSGLDPTFEEAFDRWSGA